MQVGEGVMRTALEGAQHLLLWIGSAECSAPPEESNKPQSIWEADLSAEEAEWGEIEAQQIN